MKTRKMNISLTIFALVFALFSLSFFLFGCNETKEQTISLAETKTLIVNALQLDGISGQEMTKNSTDNRNIFTKFGKTNISFENDLMAQNLTDTVEMNATIEKNGEAWSKYVLDYQTYSSNSAEKFGTKEYFDGEKIYKIDYDDSRVVSDFENGTQESMNLSITFLYFDVMFYDGAFESCYQEDVLKVTNENGFTLTIDVDMFNYATFVMETIGAGADGLFGDTDMVELLKTEGSGKIVVSFDKNNEIDSLEFQMNILGMAGNEIVPSVVEINLAKFENEINPPDWFDITEFESK